MTGKASQMSDLSHQSRVLQTGWRALCTAVVVAALGGCATVPPYERGRLAQPDMTGEWSAGAKAGQDHATAYREGATGASGSTGAGCGCN